MTWPMQPITFHKWENSLSRYFATEGKIGMEDILPQETKIDKSANCLADHGWDSLKKNKCPQSTGGYVLDVVGYGRSGPEKSWAMPSITAEQRWPESLFQTLTPLLFQNFSIRVREVSKFENPTLVQTPAKVIDPTEICPCFHFRNYHTDSCYCWNWKVTPGPVFHKFFTPVRIRCQAKFLNSRHVPIHRVIGENRVCWTGG